MNRSERGPMTIPTAAARPGLLTTGGGQVGFADLCRVAVRQHRIGIACTLVGYLGFALVVLFSRQITFTMTFHVSPANIVPGFAAVVAVFWGAPLLATEYERHTNLFAWSQDTSPGRWLLAKITVLGILIVVLTSLLTLAQMAVIGTGDWGRTTFPRSRRRFRWRSATPRSASRSVWRLVPCAAGSCSRWA